MKAAVLRNLAAPMEIEDVEVSKPGPREVLLRVAAVGRCCRPDLGRDVHAGQRAEHLLEAAVTELEPVLAPTRQGAAERAPLRRRGCAAGPGARSRRRVCRT